MWRYAVALWLAGSVMASAQVIDQFGPGAETRWRYIADGVMGGVSQGRAEITQDGLRLSGVVSTDNNGGFIQVRHMLQQALSADAQALVLSARGLRPACRSLCLNGPMRSCQRC